MMIKERQSYDREFKQKAVELSFARGNAKEIADELGIRPNQIAKYMVLDARTVKKILAQSEQAYHNINVIREDNDINVPGFAQVQHSKIPFVKPLSSRKLAKYIGYRLTGISDHYERYYHQTLLDNIAELRIVRKLVQIFKTMLSRGRGNIKRWIDFIIRSKRKLSGLKTFARGMLRDIEAVENGIKMSWSNGVVEGHVNRIKSIKRQMYGRASFEL